MPRKLRVGYQGATYDVMSRANRRDDKSANAKLHNWMASRAFSCARANQEMTHKNEPCYGLTPFPEQGGRLRRRARAFMAVSLTLEVILVAAYCCVATISTAA